MCFPTGRSLGGGNSPLCGPAGGVRVAARVPGGGGTDGGAGGGGGPLRHTGEVEPYEFPLSHSLTKKKHDQCPKTHPDLLPEHHGIKDRHKTSEIKGLAEWENPFERPKRRRQ